MRFTSASEEIRYYAKQIMADGQQYPLKVIKTYVKSKMVSGFSEGAFAGAMRDLILKEDDYVVVRRGVYQYKGSNTYLKERDDIDNSQVSNDVKVSLISIPIRNFKQAIEKTKEEINENCNILDISDQELAQINIIRSVIEQVEGVIEELKE